MTKFLLLSSDELCEIFTFLDLKTIGHLMSTHKKLLHTIQNDIPQLWRLKLHQLATINPKFHLKPKNHQLVFGNGLSNSYNVSMGWTLFKIHRHQRIFIKIRTILKKMSKLPRSDRYFFLLQSVGDDPLMKAMLQSQLGFQRMLRPETFLELHHNNDPMLLISCEIINSNNPLLFLHHLIVQTDQMLTAPTTTCLPWKSPHVPTTLVKTTSPCQDVLLS